MNIVFTYLKAHVAKDTTAAVDLADYNPSFKNLAFARKILNIKLTIATYKKCYKDKDRELNKDQVIKYKTLIEKIDTISQRKTYCDKDIRNENFEILNKYNYLKIKTNNDFSNSNISNVDLSSIFLEGSKFENSNLSGAKIRINDADFSNANLDGAEITFRFGYVIDKDFINKKLIDNPAGKIIFNTLETIDDKYSDIKIKLVKQLIKEVKYHNNCYANSEYFNAILDYIFSKEYCLENKEIQTFLKSLFDKLISPKNSKINIEPKYISLYLDLISKSFNDQEQSDFMLKDNGKFIKLMAVTLYHEKLDIQEKSRNLYEKYLKLERVKSFYEKHKTDNDEKVNWDNQDANNIIIINKTETMVTSYKELNKMLYPDTTKADTQWDSFIYYFNEQSESLDKVNLYNLFNYGFKIFKDDYNLFALNEKFNKLASKFGDYAKIFYSAFIDTPIQAEDRLIYFPEQAKDRVTDAQKKVKDGLIDSEERNEIYNVVEKLIEITNNNISTISLKNEHYQQICDIFGLKGLTDKEKSKYFLCLAIIFVKYASNDVFGLGNKSPKSLKRYAYALLCKAHKLNEKLMGDDFYDFKSDLVGEGQETTETTGLFFQMRYHGKQHCGSIFNKIMPPQWR